MMRVLQVLLLSVLLAGVVQADSSPSAQLAPVLTGQVEMHDGTLSQYEVYGTGTKFIVFGFPYNGPEDKAAFAAALGKQYKLVFSEYPRNDPKLYTLTAAAVVQDYLRLADAVGAKEFAYYGYSWGATIGLQLALRTDRIKALVAGGFPMMGGPYDQIMETIRWSLAKGDRKDWPWLRQVLTYYESLTNFDDHAIQSKVKIPRLNFLGTADRILFPGDVDVQFYKLFNDNRSALIQAGWDTAALEGHDHTGAQQARVSLSYVAKWLEKNWPSSHDGE